MSKLTDFLKRFVQNMQGMPKQKVPEYEGTPPFVYDPNHPYYGGGAGRLTTLPWVGNSFEPPALGHESPTSMGESGLRQTFSPSIPPISDTDDVRFGNPEERNPYQDALDAALARREATLGKYRDGEGKLIDLGGWKGNLKNALSGFRPVDTRGKEFGEVAGESLGQALGLLPGMFLDKTGDEEKLEAEEVAKADVEIAKADEQVKADIARQIAKAQIDNYTSLDTDRKEDNRIKAEKIKVDRAKAEAKALHDKMSLMAGIYNKSTNWNTDNETAKEFKKLFGFDLPAKTEKGVLEQDRDTGAWFIVKQSLDGTQRQADVLRTPDGKPFVTTSEVRAAQTVAEFKGDIDLRKLQLTLAQQTRLKQMELEHGSSGQFTKFVGDFVSDVLESDPTYAFDSEEEKARKEQEAANRAMDIYARAKAIKK